MTRKLIADLERIIEAGIEITDSTESFKIDADGTIGGEVSEEGGTVPWTEKIRIYPQVEEGFHDSYRKPFFIASSCATEFCIIDFLLWHKIGTLLIFG